MGVMKLLTLNRSATPRAECFRHGMEADVVESRNGTRSGTRWSYSRLSEYEGKARITNTHIEQKPLTDIGVCQ